MISHYIFNTIVVKLIEIYHNFLEVVSQVRGYCHDILRQKTLMKICTIQTLNTYIKNIFDAALSLIMNKAHASGYKKYLFQRVFTYHQKRKYTTIGFVSVLY